MPWEGISMMTHLWHSKGSAFFFCRKGRVTLVATLKGIWSLTFLTRDEKGGNKTLDFSIFVGTCFDHHF